MLFYYNILTEKMHILFCFFSGISRKNSPGELCSLSNRSREIDEILEKGEFTTYLAGGRIALIRLK